MIVFKAPPNQASRSVAQKSIGKNVKKKKYFSAGKIFSLSFFLVSVAVFACISYYSGRYTNRILSNKEGNIIKISNQPQSYKRINLNNHIVEEIPEQNEIYNKFYDTQEPSQSNDQERVVIPLSETENAYQNQKQKEDKALAKEAQHEEVKNYKATSDVQSAREMQKPIAMEAKAQKQEDVQQQSKSQPKEALIINSEEETDGKKAKTIKVQVGAFKHKEECVKLWQKIQAQHKQLLVNHRYYLEEAQTQKDGLTIQLYRLKIGDFPSELHAKEFCKKLIASGQGCFFARTQ